MKKLFKIIGIIIVVVGIAIAVYYNAKNESLPIGKQGDEADALAQKMLNALNYEAYQNTEMIAWSFRGKHSYLWDKENNIVTVTWNNVKAILHTKSPEKNELFVDGEVSQNKKLIQNAIDYFNNDSFWLVAPYKVLDKGVERSLVQHEDKDALLVTYTTGGSTPGDSYLWILDENGMPTSFKMWVDVIPIGGASATWSDWVTTESGMKLPSKHTLSIANVSLDMGTVEASNPKANALANNLLKAIKHEAYNHTRYISWSFAGRRSYKWDKTKHIIEVVWDKNKVVLHPNNIEKSTLFVDGKEQTENKKEYIQKALRYFNNDSFWLVAPHKLFETGIIRSIEKHNGKNALKVKYTTGGTTPGDSYLWLLDENFLPIKYKMYIPSMKMDGVEATWEDWITTESGALLPKTHSFASGRKLSMGDVKGYN
ncbi:MAG: hypothetical protein JKY69_01405 [Flavobacteriaceae bacterium]|nr:hypothetical protein [Flavobacteriaceae bacterium]